MAKIQPEVQGDKHDDGLREKMIVVNRVTKVVKGGRVLGFAALIVVGDGDGRVDMGKGRAKEVPMAVQKATDKAYCKTVKIPLKNGTLQHEVVGKHGATKVQMMPAKDGTGMTADGPVRAIFEVMGVANIVTKSHGSINPYNMVRATPDGLHKMDTPAEIATKRGKSVERILG